MKKLMIILLLALFSLTGCSNNENNNSNDSANSSSYEKFSTEQIITEEIEEDIAFFSTKVIDHSPGRKTNVDITNSKINGFRLDPGQTFSFGELVGKATPEKGYKKAKIFDAKGNLIDGYGGGNCQVSTTIYNAVKDLPGIEIIERHPHNNSVPYIADGLDAAVSYGSEDLKFRNNNDYAIKIYVSDTTEDVSCRITKVSMQTRIIDDF